MPFYTGRPDIFYGPMRTVEAAGELQFPHLTRLRMFDSLVKVRRSEICNYIMLWFIIVRSTYVWGSVKF